MFKFNVSFIIPVYNCEKYISMCLDSLVNQTIKNKEIIIINDGSTDLSLEICEDYSKRYNFINIINQKNQGQSIARNVGIKLARGKYIQFVDADDYVDINCGEKFFELCEKYNLDCIRGKYHIYDEQYDIKKESLDLSDFKYTNKVVNSREYFIECINKKKYEVTPILGFIRRDFIIKNNIFFKEGVTMEDHEFTMKCLTIKDNSNVMQLDYDFYTYIRHKGSTTTTPTVKKIDDIIKNCYSSINYIDSISSNEELNTTLKKSVSALFYQATSIYGRLNKREKKKAKKILDKKVLNFSIRNSFDYRQKIKFIIFKYFNNIFDLIYYIKLKNKK
ncbi:glycosyltransferase [Clostridium perfringens]